MKIDLNTQLSKAMKDVDNDTRDKIKGGLSDNATVQDIAKKHGAPLELIELMLKWGMDVESEHTSDLATAREIAKDHLMEDPIYYKKLKEIEGR